MPGPVFTRDDDLTLRTVEREDLDFVRRWHNDPALRDAVGFTGPLTADGVERQYEQWTVDADRDLNLLVCLERADGSGRDDEREERPGRGDDGTADDRTERVGSVALFDVDRDRGELAYWLVPAHRGEGYGSRAAALVLDHAFETYGLHKVVAKVSERNAASQALLDSLGFEREGVLRERVFRRGKYRDQHRFGLLAREWFER